MKKIFIFILNRIPFIIFLLFYLLFSFLTYKNYGLTNDEFFVYTRGRYFYIKVRGNDPFLQKGFAVHDRDNSDLLYNNSTYPALLYLFNHKESYEKYHLLNLLFAIAIFYAFYEILLFVYKKPFLALIGPFLLFFTPRFLGDIPANPKDVPFATFYFITLVAIILTQKWEEKLRIFVLGILIGLVASLRILGFTLLIVYLVFKLLRILENKKKIILQLTQILLESILIFFMAFLIFIVSIPYAGADPLNHTIELFKIGSSFPWYGTIPFLGKVYSAKHLPFFYLTIWIMVTTPLSFILFSGGALIFLKSKKSAQLILLILISVFLQLLLYFFFKPNIYNGIRHYLFLIPQIILLAAIFINEIWEKHRIKIIVLTILIVNLISITVSYIQLHPYEYVYFNEIVGGLKGANNKFELDYWGASEKEALTWLKQYLKKENIKHANIFTCSKSYSNMYYIPEYTDVNSKMMTADYVVCQKSDFVEKAWGSQNIEQLHIVKRQTVPLQKVFHIKRKHEILK